MVLLASMSRELVRLVIFVGGLITRAHLRFAIRRQVPNVVQLRVMEMPRSHPLSLAHPSV
jgi:hypothetical protein